MGRMGIFAQPKSVSMAEAKQLGLELSIDEQIGQGRYSNLVVVTHSASEFVLDFASMLPALPKAKVQSRIIMTPEHAKRLMMTLQDNITRYESAMGKIEVHMQPASDDVVAMGFNVGEA